MNFYMCSTDTDTLLYSVLESFIPNSSALMPWQVTFFNLYLCWCVCIADHVGLGAYENREKANFPDMQSKKWWSLHMDYQSYEKK